LRFWESLGKKPGMEILERLFRNERTMRAVFGLGTAKFDELAQRVDALWTRRLERRKNRQRAVGGGQPSKIPTGRHKLAFILFYLKAYPTLDVMSVFSGINNGECCRWVQKLLPLLEELLGEKQVLPKRRIRSMQDFAAAFPAAAEVILDGMERPVQRSKKKRRSGRITVGKRRGTHARRLWEWMEGAG